MAFISIRMRQSHGCRVTELQSSVDDSQRPARYVEQTAAALRSDAGGCFRRSRLLGRGGRRREPAIGGPSAGGASRLGGGDIRLPARPAAGAAAAAAIRDEKIVATEV